VEPDANDTATMMVIFVCVLRYGASEASLIGKHALQTRRPRSWRRFSMQWTKPPSASISMMIPSIVGFGQSDAI
jgi:hypothetical protein